jgi:hypothetical protein
VLHQQPLEVIAQADQFTVAAGIVSHDYVVASTDANVMSSVPMVIDLAPAGSVLRRGELTAVYVVSGKGFALRTVRLGASHGTQGVEILAGLAEGERIALDPVQAGLAQAVPAAQPAGTK